MRHMIHTTLSLLLACVFLLQPALPVAAQTSPPATFGKMSPANFATEVPATVTLRWNATAGAVRYGYCIASSAACPGQDSGYTSTTSTSVTVPLSRGTTYHWQVRAYNSAGQYTAADGNGMWWSFTTTAKPDPFGKITPANGATNQPVSITLQWNPAGGATSYSYCVALSNTCAPNGEASFTPINGTSVVVPNLAPNTTYYWQARAINGAGSIPADGEGTWWSFTTGALPGAFTKIGPANTATNQPVNLTLRWNPASGATSYGYCVALSNTCPPNGEASFTPVSGTSVALQNLAPNTTYYWQVRAYNAIGSIPADGVSIWWSFTTGALPAAFGKLSPANEATSQPVNLTLSWRAAAGATSYRYCVSSSNTCAPNGEASFIPVNGTSVAVALAPNTTYYWQVRAYNAVGSLPADGEGVWWRFTTTGTPPAAFSKIGPVNGSTNQPANVTLNWEPAPGATGYRYCVALTNSCPPSGDPSFISVSGTSVTLALNPATTYYWQVKAVNGSGQTVANGVGQWWSFTTGGGQVAGYLGGEFGVSEAGAATYRVPLVVPPGSAGVAPELAVAYDSRGANSLLGWGWSLAGLSLIGRCATTLALHGGIDPVDFDASDQFCLDGQMLVAVQGSYGANGTVYNTENQTFARVISYGQTGAGPQRFSVWTRDGVLMEYGATDDSRIAATGRADALYWALTRLQDTRGNYLTVTYEKTADGESYPARISYTGNTTTGLSPYATVDFVYENRPDISTHYVAGSQVRLARRLQALRVLIDGGLVREYRFGYTISVATGRSRLATLAECAGDGTCLPPTMIDWTAYADADFNFAGSGSGMWSGHSGGPTNNLTGDFNGDGRTDIAGYSTSRQQWHTCLATGGSFTCAFWNGTTEGLANTITGDFDGDGRTDLVGRTGTVVNGLREWRVCRSTGSGFTCAMWQGQQAKVSDTAVGDFDGDGRTDFAGYSGGGQWHVCLSNGSGFTCAMWNGNSGSAAGNVLADLNGDGRADMATYDALRALWRVCLSNGAGFDCAYWAGHRGGTEGNVTGDFNGDGLTDFAGYDSNQALWDVCLSTGAGFTCAYRTIHQGGAQNNAVGDFNGDGRTDLAGYGGSNGQWHVCLSTGEVFNCGSRYWTGHSAPIGTNVSGDFNGDGKTDLVGYTGSSGLWHVTLSSGPMPDLAANITTGHGARIEINHRPLNDPAIYTKDTDAVYPKRDVASAMYVVASHSTDDGLGGRWKTTYAYAGLKVNLRGRGFLGFRFIRATDDRTSIATTSFYAQEGAFKALLWKVERRLADGTLISRTDRGWDKFQSGVIFYPYVAAERVEQYEIDGTLVYSSTTRTTVDGYGSPTQVAVSYDDGYQQTTDNSYTDDLSRWILGRLTRAQVTVRAPGQAAQTRTSAFTYDPASGQRLTEVIEPNTALALTTTYVYDSFGNVVRSTQSGSDITARTQQNEYNLKGRFVVQATNPLGHVETRSNDSRFGAPTALTGPNGLITTWTYDAYGRATLEHRPDGTQTTTSYRRCDSTCPARAVHLARVETPGAPSRATYFDLLDRPIREETIGFDGRSIYIDTEYGRRGNRARVSNPYYAGQALVWNVFEYDGLNRPIAVTTPDGSRTTTAYRGLTTTITNPLNQTETRVLNNRNWLMRSVDTAGVAINYTYDSFGNLLTIADPSGNTTGMTYDLRGRQLTISIPGAGTTSFSYNAAGELIRQRNARGQETRLVYDLLGRLVERQAPEGPSRWTYDTQPKGIGKLAAIEGPDGYRATYSYDSLGRAAQTATTIDGTTYTIGTTYDSFGRVASVTYPTGLRIQQTYNAQGYLSEVRDATTSGLIWQANAITAQGQIERETLGNGLQTSRGYDALTGRLATIATGQSSTPAALQNLAYTFDQIGNLTSRTDNNRTLTETFGYDTRNRLTSAQVTGQSAVTVTYNDLGNITEKSDVGTYTYGQNGAGPHAVTSVAGALNRTYSYDADGNRLTSSTGTIAYTSFNKPSRISEGSQQLTFNYNPDTGLFRKVSTSGTTTTTTSYIGGIYEREVTGAQITYRHYIATGGTQAVYITRSDAGPQTLWVHTDHLGSVDVVSDGAGQVAERQSFDAWGKPRTLDWKPLAAVQASLINQGFTGHEQLFAVGLIHMGGRVYDPAIGRFLSQDPFVQAPENLQNLNRYSYVLNRPLSLTDPSGYSWLGDLGEKIGDFFKDNWKAIAVAVLSVATMSIVAQAGWATGLLSPLGVTKVVSGAIVGGAASGFVGGVSGTLLYGGSLSQALRNGLRGAVVGGVTASFGNRAMLGRMVGSGINGYLQTGSLRGFLRGFAAGAIPNDLGFTKAYLNNAWANIGIGIARDSIKGAIVDGRDGILKGVIYGQINNAAGHLLGLASGTYKGLKDGAFYYEADYGEVRTYLVNGKLHKLGPAITLGNVISGPAGLSTDPAFELADRHERNHSFQPGEQAMGALYGPLHLVDLAIGHAGGQIDPNSNLFPFEEGMQNCPYSALHSLSTAGCN